MRTLIILLTVALVFTISCASQEKGSTGVAKTLSSDENKLKSIEMQLEAELKELKHKLNAKATELWQWLAAGGLLLSCVAFAIFRDRLTISIFCACLFCTGIYIGLNLYAVPLSIGCLALGGTGIGYVIYSYVKGFRQVVEGEENFKAFYTRYTANDRRIKTANQHQSPITKKLVNKIQAKLKGAKI